MISRNQLVAWINQRLGSTYSGFEELKSGEDYCKLLDMLRPGSLEITKVRSGAKLDRDRMRNFKLLQQGLETAGLHKEVSIEGLMESKFRDHYELVKWFKKLFDEAQGYNTDGAMAAGAAKMAKQGRETGDESKEEFNMKELLEINKECDTYRSIILSIDSLCRKYKAEHDNAGLADKILEHLDALDLERHAAGDGPAEN